MLKEHFEGFDQGESLDDSKCEQQERWRNVGKQSECFHRNFGAVITR